MGFKDFFEAKLSETEKDIKETLNRLPAAHRKLVSGYKYEFEIGNTLDHDDQHVGKIQGKKIVVAAPWHYGREFTFLHEIAHKVYAEILDDQLRQEWAKLAKKNKKDSAEESFSMAYASHYSKHQIATYDHDEWNRFIAKLT